MFDYDEERYADEGAEYAEEGTGYAREFWRLVLFLGVVLLLLFILLPTLLSTNGGRNWILTKVNRAATPLEVECADWSLGWWRAPVMDELRVRDSARGLDVKIQQARLGRGLWGLLPWGKLRLGTVELVGVRGTCSPVPGERATAEPSAAKEGAQRGLRLPISDLAMTLKVQGGRWEFFADQPESLVLEQLKGRLELSSLHQPLTLEGGAQVGMGGVTLKGALPGVRPAPTRTGVSQGEGVQHLQVTLTDVDARAVRPVLQRSVGQPWIDDGRMEATLSVALQNWQTGALEGQVQVSGFALETQADASSMTLDRLHTQLEVAWRPQSIEVRKFEIATPWVQGMAWGSLHREGIGQVILGDFEVEATANLVTLARDFADVLYLAPDFKVERGVVDTHLTLRGRSDALQVVAQARSADLKFTAQGKPVVFAPAPMLDFQGSFATGFMPTIERLELQAPFAQLTLQEQAAQTEIKARLDLAHLSHSCRHIFREWLPMVGLIEVEASSQRDDNLAAVHVRGQVTDLAVQGRLQQMTVVPQATLDWRGQWVLQEGRPIKQVRGMTLATHFPDGNLKGGCSELVWPADQISHWQVRGGELSGDLSLPSVRLMAGAFLPPAWQKQLQAWQGRVLLNATCESAGGILKTRWNGAGRDLVTQWADGARVNLPDVSVSGSVEHNAPQLQSKVELEGRARGTLARDGVVLVAEPQIKFNLSANHEQERWQISRLELNAALLELAAIATLTGAPERRHLVTQGRLALDYAQVGKILAAHGVDEWRLSGREARPFTFKTPLAGGLATVLAEGELKLATHLRSVAGLGLEAGAADLTLDLAQGVAHLSYAPLVNGGKLLWQPEVVVGGRAGGLTTLQPASKLLERVQLTQPMIEHLLLHANPIFQGSRVLGGEVTLLAHTAQHHLKQTPKEALRLDLELVLNNLHLQTGSVLNQVLDLIKITNRDYRVARLPLHLTVHGGVIQLDPIQLIFDEQPLIVGGRVDFKGQVNYMLELPVTRKLVGKELEAKLRGTTVKVPVTGTVDAPLLDVRALRTLLTQGLEESARQKRTEYLDDFLENLQRELRRER